MRAERLPAAVRKPYEKRGPKWGTGRNGSNPLHTENAHGADISAEQVEFGRACEKEKRRLDVVSLSAAQILAVAESLGYRRFHLEG